MIHHSENNNRARFNYHNTNVSPLYSYAAYNHVTPSIVAFDQVTGSHVTNRYVTHTHAHTAMSQTGMSHRLHTQEFLCISGDRLFFFICHTPVYEEMYVAVS